MPYDAGDASPALTGFDSELRRHNEVLRRACDVQPHEHTLDIGCGTGQTTRQAAKMAREGSAFGVDVSTQAIKRARELARTDALANVTFEQADAQLHPFPAGTFDLAISRFGTMFFADPLAAFTNIGRALRADGRLVMMVWQAAQLNEWDVAIRECLETVDGPAADFEGPDAFSLADPLVVQEILQAAGFCCITFADVSEPVYYGPDVAAAVDWVSGFAYTRDVLGRLDPDAAAQAVQRLREVLAAQLIDDGVWFDSRAWIVTAQSVPRSLTLAEKPWPFQTHR